MSKVDEFTKRVGQIGWLTQGGVEQAGPAAAGKIPTGTELANGGTCHPGRPHSEGQIGVFRSPHARDAFLVDIAEEDRCGQLRWVALSDLDPRYAEAIAAVSGELPVSDADMPVEPKRSNPLRP